MDTNQTPKGKNRIRMALGAVTAAALVAGVGAGVAGADNGPDLTEPEAVIMTSAALQADPADDVEVDPPADTEAPEADEIEEVEEADEMNEPDDADELDEQEDEAVEAWEYLPAEEQAAAFDALTADQQAYVVEDQAEDALELMEELDEVGVGYTLVIDPVTGVEIPEFDETDPAAADIVADELEDEHDELHDDDDDDDMDEEDDDEDHLDEMDDEDTETEVGNG
ncbi:MAG: hypothetical protein R8J94_21650 [Acidimicrobiia bacterium]|nr:hypothetical protein [Acidimicrobiia bacterium]